MSESLVDGVSEIEGVEEQEDETKSTGGDERKRRIGARKVATRRRSTSTRVNPREPDWYGNLPLHHCVSQDQTSFLEIKQLIDSYPESVGIANQFNRLPLHYAVDRKHPDKKVIKLLVQIFPQGVYMTDSCGNSPYQISLSRNQSNRILRVLLEECPTMDPEKYRELVYGKIPCVIFDFFISIFRSSYPSGSVQPIDTDDVDMTADIQEDMGTKSSSLILLKEEKSTGDL